MVVKRKIARTFAFAGLFRQSAHSPVAAYEDVNDAQRLAQDPAFPKLSHRTLDAIMTKAAAGASRPVGRDVGRPARQIEQT